ncbi:MAG: hypothetical protein Q7J24_12270 [Desulfomicrobium sp.]|nr:hypothetical protein [Desulfomicrobium sp.]
MNLFERLVAEALQGQDRFAPIQAVVEKELLHHNMLLVSETQSGDPVSAPMCQTKTNAPRALTPLMRISKS